MPQFSSRIIKLAPHSRRYNTTLTASKLDLSHATTISSNNSLIQSSITSFPFKIVGSKGSISIQADDLVLYPNFYSLQLEKSELLSMCLRKMDQTKGIVLQERKLRKSLLEKSKGSEIGEFFKEPGYVFEEGHFDNVIKGFRECTITSWDLKAPSHISSKQPETLDLIDLRKKILERLYFLLPHQLTVSEDYLIPSSSISTHLLHLRSDGYILPHRDDLSSCGDFIIGISLGDERTMKLRLDKEVVESYVGQVNDDGIWDLEIRVGLPNGSCYVQKFI
jgi:alkylated DNA repair protein alkB homolog 7